MALRRVLLTAAFAGLGQRCLALGPATGRGAARASAGGARAPRAPPRPAPAPGPAEAAVEPTPTGGSADRYRAVTLRRGKARLFRDGSPLVYGGAINEPAASLRPSELVRVIDGTGETIGWGPYNAESMFRVRLLRHAHEPIARRELQAARRLARVAALDDSAPAKLAAAAAAADAADAANAADAAEATDDASPIAAPAPVAVPAAAEAYDLPSLLAERLACALALRRRGLGLPSAETDAYRWVNGEGDRLSGLVVDVLGSVVVVSSSALWCEAYRAEIEAAVRALAAEAVRPVGQQAAAGGAAGAEEAVVLWRRSESRLRQDGWRPEGEAAAADGADGDGDGGARDENEGEAAAEMDAEPADAGAEAATDAEGEAEGDGGYMRDGRDLRAVTIVESGVRYAANAHSGQKTGFYCDQRENRQAVRALVAAAAAALGPAAGGARVLDLCCHTGGFALAAAAGGAATVVAVDSSAEAVACAAANAAANFGAEIDAAAARGGPPLFEFVKAEVGGYMAAQLARKRAAVAAARLGGVEGGGVDAESAVAAGGLAGCEWQPFDVVILDPPKLAPSARSLERALRKYESLNANALQLVRTGGVLVTCSCSGAVTQEPGLLVRTVQEAAARVGRSVALLRVGGAAADHPLNPMYPEGAYLTVAFFVVN